MSEILNLLEQLEINTRENSKIMLRLRALNCKFHYVSDLFLRQELQLLKNVKEREKMNENMLLSRYFREVRE
jgi:hypothetical protein